MRVWTFTTIDWDLLRDDVETADTIMPVRAYATRELAAEKVAEALREEAKELLEAEVDFDPEDFEWNDDHAGEFFRWTMFCEELNLVVYLYDVEVEGL